MWSASDVPSDVGIACVTAARLQPGPDLGAVLVQPGRRQPVAGRGRRERDRVADRRAPPPPAAPPGRARARSAKATPSLTVLIGPQGTPAAISSRNHSSAVRVRSRSTSSGRRSSRLAVRSWLRRNRGSSTSSGTPSTSHSLRNWPSLPAVTISSPSAVGSASYGNRLGCALPIRVGVAPAATTAPEWLTSPDSAEESRLTSTCWPRPVAARSCSAASTPISACSPAITSKTEMPAR